MDNILRCILRVGDLILVDSIHSLEPHFYQVSYIDWFDRCVVSQPACFRHKLSSIVAIFRYDGNKINRIWSIYD